ncbi:MAG: 23S rRNA (pseudouridine(1915)-N(3))-methyltransferase RlmH [Methanoregula sp.]|jgi:23S rRNA (pseudouridine1915-N3)-methyltransferase|nr:23S rRNA (pseudouridine(1915)-N(3))-methyltransferase RlmH [Methanoregula sp.]
MQIRIIAVGKIKERFLQEGIAEYEKRLRPYVKLQIVELADEKRPASASSATELAALEKEGQRILGAIPEGSYVVSLDVKGSALTSEDLARAFSDWELGGRSHVVFIIGGDLGLSPAVLTRSDLRLSLSKMTFTHPMARLLFLEQVYRSCRIRNGEPYHK